jgi:hypothetical protein
VGLIYTYMQTQLQDWFKISIKIPYGELETIMDWCRNNCTGKWKLEEATDSYNFYFEQEKDYFIFNIWKK